MSENQGRKTDYADEINLVDLATIFVRRRFAFYVVFGATVLAGLAFALFAPEKYDYTSLLQVAEQAGGEFLEAPATTIATLGSRWLPQVEQEFWDENDEKLPFDVRFASPEGTGLIKLSSEATKDEASQVGDVHKSLLDRVAQRQAQLLAQQKKSLEAQLSSVNDIIKTLREQAISESTGTALAQTLKSRIEIESKISALKPSDVLVEGRQSVERASPKRALIVVLAVALGGILGVFVAFMAEFISLVRKRLGDANTQS